jgi:hypothetical protein
LHFVADGLKYFRMVEALKNNREKPLNPGWANLKPTKPGEVRNPHGRPLGSRNKLAEAFVADCYTAWQDKGAAAIDETIKRKPWEFVKIVSGLMPQKLEITSKFQNMADDDLRANLVRAVTELAKGGLGGPAGGRPGDQARIIEATAQQLPALPEADSISRGGGDPSGTPPNGRESAGEDVCRRS